MTSAKTEDQAQTETQEKDGPLLDLTDAAVKKLIKTAKARGYVTHDELNEVMPSGEVSSDQIEDIYAMLSEMGINVVEAEEAEEPAEPATDEAVAEDDSSRAVVQQAVPARVERTSEPTDRTDDPVRMYLREMGSVELLSREGEIAIAKRIEAGREAMIAGLCESPLTFQAIIIWHDELMEGKILLRDIIDLEATYAGPDGKQPAMPAGMPGVPGLNGEAGVAATGAAPGGMPGGDAERPARPTRRWAHRRPGAMPRRRTAGARAARCGGWRGRRGRGGRRQSGRRRLRR